MGSVSSGASAGSQVWGSWTAVDGGIGFANSWVNYGTGTFGDVEYRKHTNGMVQLRGVMKSGTIGAAAFTLPSGYRPAAVNNVQAVASNGAFGRVSITSAGVVDPTDGSNVWFSLDGVEFDSTGGT